jgi:hypothetical protein
MDQLAYFWKRNIKNISSSNTERNGSSLAFVYMI